MNIIGDLSVLRNLPCMVDESNEQFVAYFLPTPDTIEKREEDKRLGIPFRDDCAHTLYVHVCGGGTPSSVPPQWLGLKQLVTNRPSWYCGSVSVGLDNGCHSMPPPSKAIVVL